VETGLGVMERLGVAPYGPEQVCFLLHRPVLSNERLIRELGYRPRTSREAFSVYKASHV
jgi:UDP-glucose 4-epimerase